MKRIRQSKQRQGSGFTLIELLVVIAIIGLLASITLPSLKGLGRSNVTGAGVRQMLDDLAFARLKAISGRTTVYMVFVPPYVTDWFPGETDPAVLNQLTNRFEGQYASYALFTRKSVGSQPGQEDPRYLTEWKKLPEGMIVPPFKYNTQAQNINQVNEYARSFPRETFPFPDEHNRNSDLKLPYLAFNYQGQLTSARDEILPLAEGSVLLPKNPNKQYMLSAEPDVLVAPPNNYTNNLIRVNWLTGRARVEKTPLP